MYFDVRSSLPAHIDDVVADSFTFSIAIRPDYQVLNVPAVLSQILHDFF